MALRGPLLVELLELLRLEKLRGLLRIVVVPGSVEVALSLDDALTSNDDVVVEVSGGEDLLALDAFHAQSRVDDLLAGLQEVKLAGGHPSLILLVEGILEIMIVHLTVVLILSLALAIVCNVLAREIVLSHVALVLRVPLLPPTLSPDHLVGIDCFLLVSKSISDALKGLNRGLECRQVLPPLYFHLGADVCAFVVDKHHAAWVVREIQIEGDVVVGVTLPVLLRSVIGICGEVVALCSLELVHQYVWWRLYFEYLLLLALGN